MTNVKLAYEWINSNGISKHRTFVILANREDQKWYFAVTDVIQVLTGSKDVKQYIKKMRSRDTELSFKEDTICTPLEIIAKDGKKGKFRQLIQRGFYVLFNLFRHLKPNHLNVG